MILKFLAATATAMMMIIPANVLFRHVQDCCRFQVLAKSLSIVVIPCATVTMANSTSVGITRSASILGHLVIIATVLLHLHLCVILMVKVVLLLLDKRVIDQLEIEIEICLLYTFVCLNGERESNAYIYILN